MQETKSTDALPAEIGAKVKALRAERGLSGRKLAAAADISQPFLSQLESGQTSVAIATLYRIAHALAVSPADLLPGPPATEIEVIRATDLHHIPVSEEPPSTMASAVFREGRRITELSDFLIEPGQHVEEWFESSGENVVYMIDGSIRVEFKGRDDVVLGPGDAMFYPAHIPSRWRLESDSPARVVLVAARV